MNSWDLFPPLPPTPLRTCDSLQKYVSAGGCVLLNISHSAPLGDNKCGTVNTAIPKWIYWLHGLTRLSFWLWCTTQDWFKCPRSLSFTLLCIRREGCVRPLVRWGETVRFQPAWILFCDGWDLQECLFLSGNLKQRPHRVTWGQKSGQFSDTIYIVRNNGSSCCAKSSAVKPEEMQ